MVIKSKITNIFKNRKINWKSGVGELLGFAVVIPVMVIMICAVFSAAQVSTAKERLSYAAYAVCRAAIVSESPDKAQKRAKAVLEQMYPDNTGVIFYANTSSNEGSAVPNLKVGQAYGILEYVGRDAQWQKGDMVKCTIYQYVNPITPFTAGIRQQDIVMMIENTNSSEE